MIALWILVVATAFSVALIIRLAINFSRHIRKADALADQYMDAIDDIVKNPAYSRYLIEYLFDVGKQAGSFKFAILFGLRMKFKLGKKKRTDQLTKFRKELDKLDYNDKKRFLEVMEIFLFSISYRDPFFGSDTRDYLIGKSKQNIVAKISDAIERRRRDGGHHGSGGGLATVGS